MLVIDMCNTLCMLGRIYRVFANTMTQRFPKGWELCARGQRFFCKFWGALQTPSAYNISEGNLNVVWDKS